MATSLNTTTRNTTLSAIVTNAGAAAYLFVWTGTPPAKSSNAFVAPTGTNLALFALPTTQIGTVNTGVLTLGAIANATALASGTPGYYRVCTGNTDVNGSTVIAQGTAGVSSGDLSFPSTIASGGLVGVTSFTYTEGNP